jgi:hypothetical protein
MTTKASEALDLGNDVQIIREILFGQQSKQFQERIIALEEAVVSLRAENARLREDLGLEQQARASEHRSGSEELSRRIEEETRCRAETVHELEQSLTTLIEKLRAQLDEQHKTQLADQTAMLDGLLETFKAYRQKITVK